MVSGYRSLTKRLRAMSIWMMLGLVMLAVSGCITPILARFRTEPGALRYTGYRPDVGDAVPVQVRSDEAIDPSGTPDDGVASVSTGRKLAPGDPVMIYLRGPENTDLQYVLDDQGMVNLPNVGTLKLAGYTSAEAEQAIQTAYVDRGIYLQLTVIVIPQNRPQKHDFFYVYGEARGPGRYELTENMTLLQAITTAGGLTDYASPKRIYVKRGSNVKRYDIRPMLKGSKPDVELQPDDVITIKRRWF